MVHYWISVFAFAGRATFHFLGKSKGGFVFDALILFLATVRLQREYGWKGMRVRFKATLLEGVLLAAAAGLTVYAYELVSAPFRIEARVVQAGHEQEEKRAKAEKSVTTCNGLLRTETEKARLLGDQKDSQQVTINSDQTQLNAQQGVVSQCVVSLGKMNPIIREPINVVVVPLFQMDSTDNSSAPPTVKTTYYFEIFVTTNEIGRAFHGSIRCENPFAPESIPLLVPPRGGPGISEQTKAILISDREYEVRAMSSKATWSPSRPVYFQVSSLSRDVKNCRYTAME